jgi:hypothetical protein
MYPLVGMLSAWIEVGMPLLKKWNSLVPGTLPRWPRWCGSKETVKMKRLLLIGVATCAFAALPTLSASAMPRATADMLVSDTDNPVILAHGHGHGHMGGRGHHYGWGRGHHHGWR